MPKARVNGISIDYSVEGRGEPLFMIMGFSGSKMGWFFQRRAFRKHLRVVTFEEEPAFTHVGGGLLATDVAASVAEEARILQGVLEGPNVQPVKTMVEMIALLRHFEMNQKALSAQDESLGNLLSWVRA